ncbi:Glycine receptor subunit alpha-3 [Homalodisca vitripennis]|nr:Glycine receptor subunit alpha-3 [Homalodisca vitripennis]
MLEDASCEMGQIPIQSMSSGLIKEFFQKHLLVETVFNLLQCFPSTQFRLCSFAPVSEIEKPLVRQPGDSLTLEKMHCQVHMQQPKRPSFCRSWLSKFPTRSKRIDVISRITFPLVFALFNITYWSTYLFREDKDGD